MFLTDAIRSVTADYPLRVLDLSDENNYDTYQTEMRSVFECYARRDDKERFFAYVSSDESFRHMDRETIEVIGRLTNAQELLDIIDENEEEEECDVCKAIKDLIEDGRKEGALKILIELANDGSISIKEAAQKSGMEEDKFREKMKL